VAPERFTATHAGGGRQQPGGVWRSPSTWLRKPRSWAGSNLAPDLGKSIGPFLNAVGIGETVLMAWLLVKAVRVPQPDAPVAAMADSSRGS